MGKQSTVAELRFTEQGATMTGVVVHMSAVEIAVQLHPGPTRVELFAINNHVELVVVARNTMFLADTHICGFHDGRLHLSFSAPVRTVRRRQDERLKIELDINFRAIQEDGCFGLWKLGLSKNISAGGMCLVIEPGLESPRKMEILFMVPEETSDGAQHLNAHGKYAPGASYGYWDTHRDMQRTPSRSRPIKATASVSNRRRRADGYLILGVKFTMLSPSDQIRLAMFLNAPQLAAA